jgi:hypothetical protein
MSNAIGVAIVDEGSAVHRFEPGPDGMVKTGAVWGPAADRSGEWFGLRRDLGMEDAIRLPTREAAIKWLERPKAVSS